MGAISTTTTCVNPSSAAFFRISLPRAPAPITRSRHFAIFSWSHQEINRSRLNRSSYTSLSKTRVIQSSRESPRQSSLTCGDLRLQPQNVAVPHLCFRECLGILNLPPGILVMKFVAQRRSIRTVRRQPQFLHKHGDNLVTWSIVRQFHRHPLILRRVVDGNVDIRHFCRVHPGLGSLLSSCRHRFL